MTIILELDQPFFFSQCTLYVSRLSFFFSFNVVPRSLVFSEHASDRLLIMIISMIWIPPVLLYALYHAFKLHRKRGETFVFSSFFPLTKIAPLIMWPCGLIVVLFNTTRVFWQSWGAYREDRIACWFTPRPMWRTCRWWRSSPSTCSAATSTLWSTYLTSAISPVKWVIGRTVSLPPCVYQLPLICMVWSL